MVLTILTFTLRGQLYSCEEAGRPSDFHEVSHTLGAQAVYFELRYIFGCLLI